MRRIDMNFPRAGKLPAVALSLVLAAGGAFAAVVAHRALSSFPPATVRLANPNEGPSRNTYAPIVKKALPSVVNISSSRVVRTPAGFSGQMDPMFRQFFGEDFGGRFNIPKERREQSLGSGVIVSPNGYILTNNHVIDGATDIRVTMGDKREFKAVLVGSDAKTDVALLKVDAADLPAITVGDSSKVQVGDVVLAMGNPFGVGQTVTMGIVSATGRGGLGIEDYEDFIQTDAPINPGNSGGALVNDRGELVGINTAIISRAGGSQGVGFAVPSGLAHQVMDDLLKDGKVTRAYLGIVPQNVTPAIASSFGAKQNRGALVGDVSPNSPAQRAGVQTGDIILEVNGKTVEDSNQLRNGISMMRPGSTVQLKVLRNGSERELTAKLDAFPDKTTQAKLGKEGPHSALDGVTTENLDAGARAQLRLPANTQGVVVTGVDAASKAAESGLQPGDVIQQANHKPVKNTEDLANALKNSANPNLLLVNRHGMTLFVAV